jgi:hypothetical protein
MRATASGVSSQNILQNITAHHISFSTETPSNRPTSGATTFRGNNLCSPCSYEGHLKLPPAHPTVEELILQELQEMNERREFSEKLSFS